MTQCVCGCKQETEQGESYTRGHKQRFPWMEFIEHYGYTDRAKFLTEGLAGSGSVEKMAAKFDLNVTTLKKCFRAEGIKNKRGPKHGEDRIELISRPANWKRRCNKCGGDPWPNFFNCPECLKDIGFNGAIPVDFDCYGSGTAALSGLHFGGI